MGKYGACAIDSKLHVLLGFDLEIPLTRIYNSMIEFKSKKLFYNFLLCLKHNSVGCRLPIELLLLIRNELLASNLRRYRSGALTATATVQDIVPSSLNLG